jgi:gliding motility-associated-like protein
VPHSFAQLNNTFETPFYHYWSWQSKGEVTARIKAYWFEQHRLDRLSFARINPTELYVALYLNSKWEAVLGHHAPNPFTLQKPLSILYGSVSLLEAVKMSDFKGLSFTVQKNYSPFEEKLVSQIITPNNDNINDVWKIKGYEFSSKSTIKMYGINGDLIFEHKGIYNNDWNGDLLNGEKIPEGSYFYHIDLDGNQVVDLQGWILIKY